MNTLQYLTTTTTSCSICSMTTTNNDKQRLTLFINPFITKHARAEAIVKEMSLSALVEKALINYLPKETVIKKLQVGKDYNP